MGFDIPEQGWWHSFVGSTPARTGKLATVRADGSPHVAPVWVALDDTGGDEPDLLFTTMSTSVKGKAISRDPRVALCFDDEKPPFAFVTVFGTATISRDPDELLAWATRIAGRYMGAENAEAYGRRNAVPEELLVRVHVDKVVARVNVSG